MLTLISGGAKKRQVAVRPATRATPAHPKTHMIKYTILCLAMATLQAADVSVRVSDPAKAAIPGATVSLTSQDGERRTITVGSNGQGRFTGLPPGRYFIQGEAPGFDASTPQSVELSGEGIKEADVLLGIAQVR